MRCLTILLLGVFLYSCNKSNETIVATKVEEKANHIGLFSPIQLLDDSTEIFMEDYFPNGNWPDSIGLDAHFLYKTYPKTKKIVIHKMDAETPWLSTLDIYFGDTIYNILLKRSRTLPFELVFDSKGKTVQKVEVAGEINGWTPSNSPMTFSEGKWRKTFLLNPGAYQYQIVVDGNWMLDPANPVKVENGIGGYNSEMVVGKGLGRSINESALNWTAEKNDIKIYFSWKGVEALKAYELFVFWENTRIDAKYDSETQTLFVEIPEFANKFKISHIRAWAMTDRFWTNDILIPIKDGHIVWEPETLKAADAQSNVIYFMMVDRFMNGNPKNDAPLQDPDVHYKANFHGGDLAGITQKLKEGYFDSIGINMLWLSPIVRNPEGPYREYPEPRRLYSGYHGYWPISSTRVDHRFGTEAELKELVQTAHAHNIKIILDFVANHVHQEHPILKSHPEWKTSLYLEDSTLNVRLWDAQRLTTWFDTFMPSLDFDNPEVVEFQSDSALFWIKEFGLDGFRHDATKHIPTPFWRRLTQKLKTEYMLKENKELYQIGETFGSRELIGSYVGSGLLDGQFDFNYYWTLRGIFSGSEKRLERLIDALRATETAYGSHSKMGNITGNHDMPRFISYAGKALINNEDPQAAGWNRNVEIQDKEGYKRLQMLQAWLMIGPGIPVIYYGDEIGMVGAGDPDNRRDMVFAGLSAEELETKSIVSKLIHLRNEEMALQYGSTDVYVQGSIVAMKREYGPSKIWLFINLGSKVADFKIENENIPDHSLFKKGTLEFGESTKASIPAMEFDVFVSPPSK